MSMVAPTPVRPPTRLRPHLVEVQPTRGAGRHILTYTVGTALFWGLWAAVSVSADKWYGWLVIPLAAWTTVLAIYLIRTS